MSRAAKRVVAVLAFAAAIGAVYVALLFASTGFAGPGPVALAGAGGLIVLGTALWRS